MSASSCGFNSHLRHQLNLSTIPSCKRDRKRSNIRWTVLETGLTATAANLTITHGLNGPVIFCRNYTVDGREGAPGQRRLPYARGVKQESEPRHVRHEELDLLDVKVTRDGGVVRYLEGGRYGLITSAYLAEITPNSGPEPHAHPYPEFFIIHAGRGRYYIGGEIFEADAGDVVVVPPKVVHHFVNAGTETLQHTAVHEAPARRLLRPAQPDRE